MTSISTFECSFSRRVGSGEHRCGQGGLIALEAIGLHSGRDHFLGPGCPLQFSEECGEPSRILCLLVRDLAHLSWHRRENSWWASGGAWIYKPFGTEFYSVCIWFWQTSCHSLYQLVLLPFTIYIHIYMYIATFYMYVQDFKVKVYMCNIESVVARCR